MTTASKLALSLTIPEEDRKVAHERHERLIGLKAELSRNAFAFGAALAEMRDRKHYLALGYPTFGDYLLSGEVAIGRATAYRFISIVQTFGHVHHDAHRMDWNKYDILGRLVESGDDPEQVAALVEQASAMPREALRAAVGAAKQTRLLTNTLPAQLSAPPVVPAPPPDVDAGAVYAYPTDDTEEWPASPPIEVAYEVAPQHPATFDQAEPGTLLTFRPAPVAARQASPEAQDAAHTIIESGRTDFIAQDFDRLIAYMVKSTEVAPKIVRGVTIVETARALSHDEINLLRHAMPVLEYVVGVYAEFHRQNVRAV